MEPNNLRGLLPYSEAMWRGPPHLELGTVIVGVCEDNRLSDTWIL